MLFRHHWGCRTETNFYKKNWKYLESYTIASESLVQVIFIKVISILSSAEHEKFRMKLPGPSGKAKYSWETDSEQVLWRKGEKNLEQRSEKEPETMRLQAVGALI